MSAYTFSFTGLQFDEAVFAARPQTDAALRQLVRDRFRVHAAIIGSHPGINQLVSSVTYSGKLFQVKTAQQRG